MKYLALVLVFATPSVLAETINMACPPGDKVVVNVVANNGNFDGSTDGLIGDADFQIMRNHLRQPVDPSVPESVMTDLNADGFTNSADYALLKMLASQQN